MLARGELSASIVEEASAGCCTVVTTDTDTITSSCVSCFDSSRAVDTFSIAVADAAEITVCVDAGDVTGEAVGAASKLTALNASMIFVNAGRSVADVLRQETTTSRTLSGNVADAGGTIALPLRRSHL